MWGQGGVARACALGAFLCSSTVPRRGQAYAVAARDDAIFLKGRELDGVARGDASFQSDHDVMERLRQRDPVNRCHAEKNVREVIHRNLVHPQVEARVEKHLGKEQASRGDLARRVTARSAWREQARVSDSGTERSFSDLVSSRTFCGNGRPTPIWTPTAIVSRSW